MCGIAGAVGLHMDEAVVRGMLRSLENRGPDGSGVYQNKDCTLLHTRLAIIDPEGGAQPMELTWQGGQYVLVYNGELYNTLELRSQLETLGHRFLTHSDTEVVLHSYAQWGNGCVEKFNGIFAFAVWEEHTQRLFLARDRIGVKPLFYALHREGILFGSEIKVILEYSGFPRQLSREGAAELILLGPGRTPGCGVFHGVQELEPGCIGWFTEGKFQWTRYWQLRDREHRESFGETVECVRYLVEDAIKRQMVSDVPIGTFLSGGLDSSIISAVCAREMQKEGKTLHTFSVDYLGNDVNFVPGKFQPNSDTHYIHTMESSLQTKHHWSVLTSA